MTMTSTLKNPKRPRSRFRPRTSHARRSRAKASRARGKNLVPSKHHRDEVVGADRMMFRETGASTRACGKNGGGDVSDRLEALKNLVPSKQYCRDEVVGADRLLQETADYIMVLRAQVVVLQTLIHFYGSSSSSSSSSPDDRDLENPNVV